MDHFESISRFEGSDPAFHINFPDLNGVVVPAHDHDFAEIVLITGGSGFHISIYGEEEVARGACLIVMPGTWHGYRVRERLQVANCCFQPEMLQHELAIAQHDAALAGLLDPAMSGVLGASHSRRCGPHRQQLSEKAFASALEYLQRLYGLQYASDSASVAERRGWFLLLLSTLPRSLSPAERELWERAGCRPPAVRECLRLLDNDLSRNWTLQELAMSVHFEPSYLGRVFKTHVGQTPFAYLHRCRLERAASLLLSTAASIGEIGAAIGWENPAHFARRFHQHFGCSAREFRRRHQAANTT